MDAKRLLVTGSGGLIGSAVVRLFCSRGWRVWGVDNDQRGELFGQSVLPNIERLRRDCGAYSHWGFDIRQLGQWPRAMIEANPSLIVHAAAQPSHDWAADDPLSDFDINARATLAMLEAYRTNCPRATFVYLSTNKVYGTRPNLYEDDRPGDRIETSNPIPETERVDATTHSLFGVSKLAADLYVQEYRSYHDLTTYALRCGCVTGPDHAGAERHGFLNYLFRCALERRTYSVFGYEGRQVRDNIHAADVALAIAAIHDGPEPTTGYPAGAVTGVYNLGGGPDNSCSLLEAARAAESRFDTKMDLEFHVRPRKGDHISYVTDLTKFRRDFPAWNITRTLEDIYDDLADTMLRRKEHDERPTN